VKRVRIISDRSRTYARGFAVRVYDADTDEEIACQRIEILPIEADKFVVARIEVGVASIDVDARLNAEPLDVYRDGCCPFHATVGDTNTITNERCLLSAGHIGEHQYTSEAERPSLADA
jgi:hypothetical protein